MPRHRTGGGRKAAPRSPRPVARAGISRRAPETVAEGIFAGTKTGYGFVTAEGAVRDIFIPWEKTGGALDGDRVLCRYHTYTSGGIERTEGEVTRVTEAVRKTVVGTLCEELYGHGKHRSVRYFVEPDDTKLTILCYLDDVGDARLGDKVEALLPPRRPGSNFLVGEYLRSFGAAASREANYAAILSECAIPTEFSREEREEAERVAKMPLTAEGRVDRRDEVIFTIDGAGAKDLDDAVSLRRKKNGNYLLGVHIADVSTYVRPRGALDACSLSRGTSVYFTDKVVPMLPEALSNGACSLNAGEDKYALSCLMELTPDGSLAHTSIERSIIRSCVRGVYSEVNDLFEKGKNSAFAEKYSRALPTLRLMHRLYLTLAEKSRARGALDLEQTEAEILLDAGAIPSRSFPAYAATPRNLSSSSCSRRMKRSRRSSPRSTCPAFSVSTTRPTPKDWRTSFASRTTSTSTSPPLPGGIRTAEPSPSCSATRMSAGSATPSPIPCSAPWRKRITARSATRISGSASRNTVISPLRSGVFPTSPRTVRSRRFSSTARHRRNTTAMCAAPPSPRARRRFAP